MRQQPAQRAIIGVRGTAAPAGMVLDVNGTRTGLGRHERVGHRERRGRSHLQGGQRDNEQSAERGHSSHVEPI